MEGWIVITDDPSFFHASAKNACISLLIYTCTHHFFIKNLIVQYTYQQVYEQIAMIIPPIYTTRLCIRPFVSTDGAAVATYASDPTVMHYMGSGAMSGAQIDEFITQQTTTEAQAFAVVLRDSTTLIGHMMFHPWFAPRTYELGWVIAPHYQGHGYASEAACALRDYSFASLDAHRVIAT